METYKTPGVYVEEIPTLPASVAQVSTAIPAFIGYTEKAANTEGVSLTEVPTRITSLPDYEALYGKARNEIFNVQIRDRFSGGDAPKLINRTIKPLLTPSPFNMYYALQMYFMNGGGPCYIVSVGGYSETPLVSLTNLGDGLEKLEQEDEPTLIVFPEGVNLSSSANYNTLISNALNQCAKLKDRFTIVDVIKTENTRELSSDYLKYGAAYYPNLNTVLNFHFKEEDVTLEYAAEISGVAYENPSIDLIGKDLIDIINTEGALYNAVKSEIAKIKVILPPSSSMAGVYARVDNDRGVWKAPANVSLNGVISPTIKITNETQDGLNIDPIGGKSINAIRTFTGKGILVWGARTLAGNDNEWRYVSVRRFFNMVEESIQKATGWVVFEPNDANSWLRIKGMIENYLNGLWRQGALVGAKPQQAYFVNVGLGTTMTSIDVLEGRMNVEIGLATARPAEFIILKFSHKLQEA
ncbi:MAG: phage tail sheath family protein [Crocinitomix sp.]|nr:phage tail sheath family protein [Crocinitomix sp.]